MHARLCSMRRGFAAALTAALMIAHAAPSHAQLTLGRSTLAQPSSRPLRGPHLTGRAKTLVNPMTLRRGLRSSRFLLRVGGVAFGAVAQPVGDVRVVALRYVPSRPDGSRLQVHVVQHGKKRVITAPIYDWQLVPIAKFANQSQHSVFTLFGELKSKKETEAHLKKHHRVLNYQSAFENTLLGLRMFQADILIFSPDAAYLPKHKGRYLLGAGERRPNISANRRRFRTLNRHLSSRRVRHQAYVINDANRSVRFRVAGHKLLLTGKPFWHCWRRPKMSRAQQLAIYKRADKTAKTRLARRLRGLTPAMRRMLWPRTRLQREYDKLFDDIVSKQLIIPMPAYSRSVTRRVERLRGINPAVYNALVVTMRYAAFFRHVKRVAPRDYAHFMRSIPNRTRPSVVTPSVYKPVLPPGYRRRVHRRVHRRP